MKPPLPASACRHCGCYVPEGRRGGQCQQLGVLVQGSWSACPFAIAPFAPTWETWVEPWSANVLELSLPRPRSREPIPVSAGPVSLSMANSHDSHASYSDDDVA